MPNCASRFMAIVHLAWLAAMPHACASLASAREPSELSVGSTYAQEIRPLFARYCHKCHGGEATEADINLQAIVTSDQVGTNQQVWEKVREMLDGGLMPPEEATQPTEVERTRLRSWVHDRLRLTALGQAGDPGPVVLRRLSNAEYTYTIRDLTKVESLDPAREFPVDGAAGEGFTNVGSALVMSPALVTKYFDAAKQVASHAVLLPDGFRFSAQQTSRDWTNEVLAEIRQFYSEFSDARGGNQVNLQGIVFDTNQGGRLAIETYLTATLSERAALAAPTKSIETVARERRLNAKYLEILWSSLTSQEPSLVLDQIRASWQAASPDDVGRLVAEIAAWQKGLWRFTTVGHIGKVGGPQKWMEPVNPLVAKQELRIKIPSTVSPTTALTLVASDAGDGNEHDFVIWHKPRLVAPGRADLPLRNALKAARAWEAQRAQAFDNTARYLAAVEEAFSHEAAPDISALAAAHGVEASVLGGWLKILGVSAASAAPIDGHLTAPLHNVAGHQYANGWGNVETPLVVANSSDQAVRIPGTLPPHSVAVHPSPSLDAAIAWRSPITGRVRIVGTVAHAHPDCGNGVSWLLEVRRGTGSEQLVWGTAQGERPSPVGPLDDVVVRIGDVVSLVVNARDRDHTCDLTAINFTVTRVDGQAQGRWDLAEEVSGNILAGNPHADRLGNKDVWNFYVRDLAKQQSPLIPAGSLLAKWRAARGPVEKRDAARALEKMLTAGPPTPSDSPDAVLYRQLAALGGPLFPDLPSVSDDTPAIPSSDDYWAVREAIKFGKHPSGHALETTDLCVRAPSVIQLAIPTEVAAGCELVTEGYLDPLDGSEGSVQLQVTTGEALSSTALRPSTTSVAVGRKIWSDNEQLSYSAPVVVAESSTARRRIERAFDEFRKLFPPALCYTKIVPVDEVVTLNLFYREDDHLVRLMLDDKERQHIDQLWSELRYISRDSLTLVDALEQLIEYATQDADPKVFEPLRKPFSDRAAAFRQQLVESEASHWAALTDFAARAYRRPLTPKDTSSLRELYDKLRVKGLGHEDAFRLVLARVLVAPDFLYRIEKPAGGAESSPLSSWELANRLSYFLWSSQPDDELRQVAAGGALEQPNTLRAEMGRMLQDDKIRRLATEFACQWLQIYDFTNFDQKSERHFPTFNGLRSAMYEEPMRFFTALFRDNRPILDVVDADYVFVNGELAQHYEIPNVDGAEWRRIESAKQLSRGGILAMAAPLSAQSGASRTSPILRGTWISEVLLGEKLPKPPRGVPPLPDDEAETDGLTVRQLVERHVSDPACASCHKRFDPYGFALEAFDAIGRYRTKDLGDRPIDAHVITPDGLSLDGLAGLRQYLVNERRDAFVRQFCKKLLGYALGRAVQLSDEPLLNEMQHKLASDSYRVRTAIETIVLSRQFREIRGRDALSTTAGTSP